MLDVLLVAKLKTLTKIPDESTIIAAEAIQYIVDHLKIQLEQKGPHTLNAKLIIKTESSEHVISEDSISYEPRPVTFC